MLKALAALLVGITISFSSVASQTVEIIWPFAPGSHQASALRKIIENANSLQENYKFVFGSRPGAGGAISVQHMLNEKKLVLTMHTTRFFTRPIFYPNESYNVNDLTPVAIPATMSPLVIVSKKYKNLNEIKKQKELTVGVNYGSITEITARALQLALPDTKLILVSYPVGLNAVNDAIGGHIDMTVNLPRDIIQHVETGNLFVVGSTGTKDYPGIKTFKSQGINELNNLVVNYIIIAASKIDNTVIKDISLILSNAGAQSNVRDMWVSDYAIPSSMNLKEVQTFWNNQVEIWPQLTKNLPK
jgi:tripartite-type tricarboxylate transporter receptor subunit TctC